MAAFRFAGIFPGMRTLVFRLAGLACAAGAAVTCGSDTSAPSSGFVQIASVIPAPTTATCGVQAASTYTVVYQINLVNTTAEDATVTKIGTSGVVISGSLPEDVGKPGHVFPSIPFTPESAVIVARTGDITVRATMTLPCGQHPSPGNVVTRDISTTVTVTTTSGQYNSTPFTVRVQWLLA